MLYGTQWFNYLQTESFQSGKFLGIIGISTPHIEFPKGFSKTLSLDKDKEMILPHLSN